MKHHIFRRMTLNDFIQRSTSSLESTSLMDLLIRGLALTLWAGGFLLFVHVFMSIINAH